MSAAVLPRYYAEEPAKEREVALYIDGHYAARGPASEGEKTARFGFPSWNDLIPTCRLTWERDRGPFSYDTPYLCWTSGERLSSEELLAWLANA